MNVSPAAQSSCPECEGQIKTDRKHGEQACIECGNIISEEAIDCGPEWRAFSAHENDQKSRVGVPITRMLHDKGLSTNIGWENRDANGSSLSTKKRTQLKRLRKWNTRCQTYDATDRNLKQALAEINRMASALGLPQSARETASVIYRRALDEDLLRGRSIEAVATATVYAATRQVGIPRTLEEMAAVARVAYDPIARAYRTIATELGLAIEPTDPKDYLPRFGSELDCSRETQRTAYEILQIITGTAYMGGKNPAGLAAAALYSATCETNERITQQAISEVAGVSCMTIRTHYQELRDRYE